MFCSIKKKTFATAKFLIAATKIYLLTLILLPQQIHFFPVFDLSQLIVLDALGLMILHQLFISIHVMLLHIN